MSTDTGFMRKYFLLFCKGVAMGAADVVPGVSGGTIAFISGIYEQLLAAISSFNLAALTVFKERGFAALWQHVHGTFLAVLVSGILLSVATFARVFSYLLEYHPLLLWGFFFGLIVASIIYIWRQIPVRTISNWLFLALGASVVLATAFAPHLEVQPSPLFVFGAGMIAICAMILPGISGSFILLLLGMYPVVLGAISNFDFTVLIIFCGGCLTGLMLFSRLLFWLLRHFHSHTLATLTGFLVGSLVVVWPWQQVLEVGGDAEHPVTKAQLFWPWQYAETIGDPQSLLVLGLMAVGLALVLVLEMVGGGSRDQL